MSEIGLQRATLETKPLRPRCKTHLENIDTLACDVTEQFVLIVEVPSEHLGRLVDGMFNLDSDSTTSLGFLHSLLKPSIYLFRDME